MASVLVHKDVQPPPTPSRRTTTSLAGTFVLVEPIKVDYFDMKPGVAVRHSIRLLKYIENNTSSCI